MSNGYDWIVNIDLEKLSDTVSHDKLTTLMGKAIKDGEIMSIIGKFLASGIKEGDEYRELVIGIQQGGNLSLPLVNIMRNELDREMEQRGLSFVRYADDCINMVGSEISVEKVMRNITRFIEEKPGLKVNTIENRVDKSQGIKYFGYGFYFDSGVYQYKARPHAKSVTKFKARMKQPTYRSWRVSNIYKVQRLNELIRGWISCYRIGSMKPICARLDGSIRYRIRMYIRKHWKTPQN